MHMFSYSKTLELLLIANSLIKEEKQDPVIDKKTKKELKKQQKNDKLRIIMDNLRYCHKCNVCLAKGSDDVGSAVYWGIDR